MANEGENVGAVTDFLFLGSKVNVDGDCSHEIRRQFLLGRKAMTNLDNVLKSSDIHFANKGPYTQGYGLSSSHVQMLKLDYKEGWALKNWCFRTMVLEKTWDWESLGQQGDQNSQSKRKSTLNTHWKYWCWSWNSDTLASWYKQLTHWKRPCCWERLKAKVQESDRRWAGWMASPIHELGQTPGEGEGQGSLVYCSQWGYKVLDMTWWPNSNMEK